MAISESARPAPVGIRWNPFDESWTAVLRSDEDRQIPSSSPYWIALYEVPRQDNPSTVTVRLIVELGEALDASETDVDLGSAADYDRVNVDDVILVDSEQMLVTSKGTSPTINVTRGYGGTTATTHSIGTIMEILASMTEVTSGSPADRQFRVDYSEARMALILFNSAQGEDWVRVDYYGLGTPLNTEVEWPKSMIADAAVGQPELKTALGSQLQSGATGNQNLGGGYYGFYPQTWAGAVAHQGYLYIHLGTGADAQTSAAAWIGFTVTFGTFYARQRYVQSSGELHWVYVLREIVTKEIKGAWEYPDHPAFGSDPDTPHPFGNYQDKDPTPDGLEILCMVIDPKQIEKWEEEYPDVQSRLEWMLGDDFEIVEAGKPWPNPEVTIGHKKKELIKKKIGILPFVKYCKLKKK